MPTPYVNTSAYGSVDRAGGSIGDALTPVRYGNSDVGAYFSTVNPTPGTPLAYNVQASYSGTVPFLYFFNNASVGGARVYIDYIKLIVTTAAASAVQAYYAFVLDTAARTLSPDNTATLTPNGTNTGITVASNLQVKAQNSATASAIAAASTNARVTGRGAFGGIPIVGDELVIDIGADSIQPYAGLTAAQATCPGRKISSSSAFVLAPQTSATMHLWFPSNATTGLSYELEIGSWER